MASPDGRMLRIENLATIPDVERRADVIRSKPCVVAGCTGTMQFHKPLEVAPGAHTLEWRWWPSWRCMQDPAHVQTISPAEAREIIRSVHPTDPTG
jgi:hypothetical protein